MSFRRFLVIAAALVAVAACSSDGDDEVLGRVITEVDSTTEVHLVAGEEFAVRLESNPSTGYHWVISSMSTPDLVEFQLRSYEDDENADVVGASGFDVFTFEAGPSGAGILRLEYVRSFDDPPVPDRVVEYIIRIDDAPWPPQRDTPDEPAAATATVPTPAPAQPGSDVVDVTMLIRGQELAEVTVGGAVVWNSAGARLCEVLLESFPAQCGGSWVVIANPDRLTVEMDAAGGVRWTPSRVDLSGRYNGERFIIGGDDDTIKPTPADLALADAFVALAGTPTVDAVNALPFATVVALGLGPDGIRNVDQDDLANPASWSLDRQEFRGYAGPFSALDVVAAPYQVTIGAHGRCVAPPEPAPQGFADHRRVSLQPTTATSCLEWWTVDLFLNEAGEVAAVTVDLFGP